MSQIFKRPIYLVLCLGALLALAANAPAAESRLDEVFRQLQPAANAPLLGPIDESGRAGWTCTPELQARAHDARESALPETER